MDKFKRIISKILFSLPVFISVLVPAATAMLIYAFAAKNANPVAVYASYFLSAYALTIFCMRIPDIIKSIRSFKEKNVSSADIRRMFSIERSSHFTPL